MICSIACPPHFIYTESVQPCLTVAVVLRCTLFVASSIEKDIAVSISSGWLRHLPSILQPYLQLMRLHQPTGIWLLLLPCLWGLALAGALSDLRLVALFTLGALVMRGAGCAINDMWDRNIDKQVARTQNRPLASGALSMPRARAFTALLLLIGLLVLVQLPALSIALGLLSLPLVVLYPLMKRITWWPQLFLGLTFNMGVLIGYAAAFDALTPAVWILYLAAIAWTVGYDTIYAHQDKQDDARIGVKSTALRLGAHTKQAVTCLYMVMLLCFAAIGVMQGMGVCYGIIMLIVAAHLFWQVHHVDLDNPHSAMHTFKTNRLTGLGVMLALACG